MRRKQRNCVKVTPFIGFISIYKSYTVYKCNFKSAKIGQCHEMQICFGAFSSKNCMMFVFFIHMLWTVPLNYIPSLRVSRTIPLKFASMSHNTAHVLIMCFDPPQCVAATTQNQFKTRFVYYASK